MRIDKELYQNATIGSLIIFCIYSLAKSKEKCSFERLVKECFDYFPAAFSFSRFPQWPDSRKLDRPLRILRQEKIIKGGPGAQFSLTKPGLKRAEEIARSFGQRKLKL